MAENTIEVIVRAVDQLSGDFKKMEGQMRSFQTATDKAGQSTEVVTTKSRGLANQLRPLTSGISQVSFAVARLNPQFAVAITSIDNMTFAALRAAQGATSLGSALRAGLAAAFNPITIGVLALVAALGFLVKNWFDAKQAAEEFDKVIETHGRGLSELNAQYRTLVGQATAADAALAKLRSGEAARTLEAARLELSRLESIRGALPLSGEFASQTALSILGVSDKQMEEARRRIAQLEAITRAEAGGMTREIETRDRQKVDRLLEQIKLETQLIGIKDKSQRDAIQIESKIAALRQQGTAPKDLADIQTALVSQAAKQRAQEFTDTLTKGREDWIKGWEEDLTEDFPKIYQEASEIARKFDEETLRQRTESFHRIQLIQLESTKTVLDEQLNRLKEQEAPAEKILAKARELDAVEKQILKAQIDQLEALAAQLEAQGKLNEAAEARAKAEALRTTGGAAISKAQREAEKIGGTIADGIITGLKGGKQGILEFMASLGEDMARKLLKDFFAGLLLGKGAGGAGGGLTDLLGQLGDIWKLIFGGFGGMFPSNPGIGSGLDKLLPFGSLASLGIGAFGFKHGGMVIPQGAMRAFQHGGVVRGPTVGVIGEEGPEIVARMKPARAGMDSDKPIQQNIFIVDQRRPSLGPNEVELVISDSIERGRAVGRAVVNTLKRSR